ncbi:hypothetical protein GCM10017567_02490 [Amycolatopsis bullii]|uniref:Uncharacterized protein n=1 Tax=Amycolatopsis bullii TaxID=941987 RepID=A0ABQ3JVJ7_9PSEU|nr:hypothetical protein GCM10017567_02490 [Amycolatopsis bullii]
MLRLQASAGNAAVSRLVALQRQSCPAPPVAPPGVTPASDPKFQSLKKDVGDKAKTAKAHPPAAAEVKKAQDAAVAPADDKDAQAKAAQADKMAAAKPAGFDKAAFIAAVNAAIAKQAPKNLDEADKFATSGKADQVKTEVLGKVTSGKDASAKDVTDRTKEPPDPGRAVEKPVTPLPEAPAPPALTPPDARKATPDKAPPEQTDLRADQCETHGAMAAAGVTDQQLAESNEPAFTGALAAKQEGEQHTASAPAAVRESEAGQLAAVTGAAQASGQAAMAGMTGARSSSAQRGQAAKSATKSKDEQDRARITGEIKAIFDETKTKVEGVLGALDDQVAKRFEAGEAQAKAAFTADHQARMKRYRDERYDGVTGAARWAYDLFADLPAEANNLFLEAKKVYESKMQAVISDIADFVGQKLTEAKQLISDGRAKVQQKVASQSPALRKIAGEAAKEFGGQFDDLEKSVDEKQESLVEDLAQKYTEARNAVDEEIKALQAENKGLWSKAKEAVGGAIETILSLKNLLLGVLSRAANAVGLIIAKPIEFLGNLVNAVKTGVMNFGANIVQHLKDGLKGWLLGNLANAGIEIPESLDAKGILKMVLSLLGLTWASVRARILRFIPEPVLTKLEQTFEVVKILITEGVPGLRRWIVEKLGDLKEMVLGQIKEFVIEKIVKAGITWIISMLNPAAAFIKACKAIYDIVMFFVDKAAQIKEFVDSVLDSVESIARGGAGAVAGLIERTLAKALPMVLGFLASLLGLGGISEKIKSVLEKVQAPVGKVIDSVVGTIVKAGKKVWSKLKGGKKKDDDPPAKQKRLDDGLAAAQSAVNRFAGRPVMANVLKPLMFGIKLRYRMTRLEVVPEGEKWAVEGEVNPKGKNSTNAQITKIDPQKVRAAISAAKSELARAKSEYKAIKAHDPEAVLACGNGQTRRQGGGSSPEHETKDAESGQRWLEADAARWGDLGRVTAANLREMTTLTPAAERKLRRLRKQESIDELLSKSSSYMYAGRRKKDREAHLAKTGEYLPRRDFKDRGIPGATSVVHAEKLLRQATGAQAIGVDPLDQCGDCQMWFQAQAKAANDFIVVASKQVRIFMPDGTVKSPSDFR